MFRFAVFRFAVFRFTVGLAAALSPAIGAARADMTVLTDNTRFCPTWAAAHERTRASLNNGRPPYPDGLHRG
jgi:hypothetical protein